MESYEDYLMSQKGCNEPDTLWDADLCSCTIERQCWYCRTFEIVPFSVDDDE